MYIIRIENAFTQEKMHNIHQGFIHTDTPSKKSFETPVT